jgi:type I restriction enzyme S subunit
VDFRFAFRALQFSIEDVIAKARGDIPGLSKDHILKHTIRIPGTRTQEAVASKIDEIFSEIEEGERALEKVRTLVERYRQSVLKAAVTGELTRDWREKHKDKLESGEALLARILKARREAWETAELAKMKAKSQKPSNETWKNKYEEPSAPDRARLPALPEGWVWASMDQLGIVSGGLTKNRDRDEIRLKKPYLRVANVYFNRLELGEVHEIGVSESELDRVLLRKNDLLVVEGNGSVGQIGRVALWDGSIEGCVHQNHLIKVRFADELLARYALVWCVSPNGRANIEKQASSTAGLHTLSISKIARLPVPIANEAELALVLDEFEAMDSRVLAIEADVSAIAKRSSKLRQGTLRSAFGGRLVPQDPTDEPASVLLERIAAERTAASSSKKKPAAKPLRRNKKAKA